jgi:hypothetical protein
MTGRPRYMTLPKAADSIMTPKVGRGISLNQGTSLYAANPTARDTTRTNAAVNGMAIKLQSMCAVATRPKASAGIKKWNIATLNAWRALCRSSPPGLKNRHMYPAAMISPNE